MKINSHGGWSDNCGGRKPFVCDFGSAKEREQHGGPLANIRSDEQNNSVRCITVESRMTGRQR